MSKIINLGNNVDRGFFSYVYTTFSTAYACNLKGEPFYIDWSSSGHYRSAEGPNPFEYFFKQPFFETPPQGSEVFSEYGLYLSTDVVPEDRDKWNETLTDFLILKDNIKEEIENYYNDNFLGKKILCVHKRGSDHAYHMPIQPNAEYFAAIDLEMSNNHYDKIFLATDEEKSVEDFKNKYGDKLICLDNIRTNNDVAIFKKGVDKYRHTREVIMDAYLLSKGDKLIKTKSTLTTIVCYINKNLEYISIDNHLEFRT